MWITNAYQADWVCLLVNTEQDKPIHLNKSLVCVPMDTKGITLAKRIDKMGMRASDTGIIYFEDVRVPIANIIGQEGYGFTYQMMQVNKSNFFLTLSPTKNRGQTDFPVPRGKVSGGGVEPDSFGKVHH